MRSCSNRWNRCSLCPRSGICWDRAPSWSMTARRSCVGDRLRSGHAPLDEVLGGGLPANAISLVMGRPGAGKTILAQQYAFRNARPERPAVYSSTASEPLDKIVRFGQSLTFFDTAAIGTSVFYEDLGT